MDAVAGLLDGPRAREAFLLRATLAAPWSVGIRDGAPLTVLAVARGSAWLVAEGVRRRLVPGDVAVVQGPAPYLVADDPDRPPDAVILPGQVCAAPDGGEQHVMGWVAPRTWGNAADGGTELLVGTYTVAREVSRALVAALPPALVLGADEWHCPLLPLLADEVGKDLPGQDAVLDRLLDLVLVTTLRAWFDRAPAPAWYRAHDDPVAGPALALMQHEPHRPWTLAALADTAGVSRATFARRFAEAVGEPPMAFLTRWRLDLAADLLRESDDTLEAVARRVGYATPYALSTAFRRAHGVSPRDYRRRASDPA
ncbi:AraC family transcriptional regulator [Jatrophihabitans fulvus]